MAELLNMPKLGMDMEEGTILHWFKKVGESVKKGEELAEIETDKASVTLEAPADGIILCLYCQEEESVPVNQPIAAIGQAGEQPPQNAVDSVSPVVETPEQLPEVIGDVKMASVLNMPKLGMDMEEGCILRWRKKEGDFVQKGEVIVEIETDKASMELEAPVDGIVLCLYHKEEESVPVNQPIAAIGQPGDQIPQTADRQVLERHQEEVRPKLEDQPPVQRRQKPVSMQEGRRKASPRARRLAQQHGVDLRQIQGTGSSGRIVEKDVRSFLESRAALAERPVLRMRNDTVLPMSRIRKVIATRMHKSLSEMAQANHRMDVDMTNMIALRRQLNGAERFANTKISFVDLLVSACSKALIDCPFANVSLEADGIHQKNYANIGVAVDTSRGLVVPVIHDVDIMNIQQIAQANRDLIEKAREGTLTPDEMSGGTFTVTNLGMFGIDSFTAIVNPPEACILAVGRIVEKVVAENGAPVIRPIMNLSLTYDHRILDGAPAARLLQRIQYYVENPALLLL